jgi:hypothetical protein
MQITMPSEGPDGPSGWNLIISAVSGDIIPYLESAKDGTSPLELTYVQYATSDLTQPGEVWENIKINKVTLDASSIQGQPIFEEIDTQAFPLLTYDEEYYPMLQAPSE